MYSGSQEVAVSPGAYVSIRADHTFTVYGMNKGHVVAILGPDSETARFVRFRVPPNVHSLKVKTGARCKWQMAESIKDGREHPDPTPIEVGVRRERPNTLHEEMKRFIRDEVSRHYSQNEGAGTFEEEDDFDVDDDPELVSPYEFTEMQEEAPIEPPANGGTTTEEPGTLLPPGEGPDSSTNAPQGREQQEQSVPATEPSS